MPIPPKRRVQHTDPRAAAEALFKPVSPEPPLPQTKSTANPTPKVLVSLRIDRDVLDQFQEAGPGWQDRINEALRRAARALPRTDTA
jgi:uncharacterized protein (DUF4415 family)